MRRFSGRATHCEWRWARGLATAGLLSLGACAPRGATTPLSAHLPRTEPAVRVGLVVDSTAAELSSSAGMNLVSARTGALLGQVPAEGIVVVTADSGGGLVLATSRGSALPAGTDLVVARPVRGGTLTLGGRPYRGALLLRPSGNGRLTVINQVDLEAYLLGVVPREIGKVGEQLLEAAKAQAVAARTYTVKYLGRREDLGFDLFATVQDQVYGGVADEHEPVSRAVRETAGEILLYEGDPIEAYYHSTCAGQTAAIQDVWPGERPRPYLTSVVDVDPRTGVAYDTSSSRFRWTQRWTADEINDILARTLADSLPAGVPVVGRLRDVVVLQRSESGRIREMRITTDAGVFAVGGDRIRWVFLTPKGAPLNSSKFDLRLERDAQGRVTGVVATGGGWGHGIGMCQVGAMGRARAGQDYRTILEAYYPSTRIADLY